MPYHPSYSALVLQPDYSFARAELGPYLLATLCAHLAELAALGLPGAGETLAAAEDLREFRWPAELPQEDLFFAIEAELQSRVGPAAAASMRLGISRNDVDMTAYRMWARAGLGRLQGQLLQLRGQLLGLAAGHVGTLMAAETHHQPAQPERLGHLWLAAACLMARDQARLAGAFGRVNLCPLGAAALAGSVVPVDRRRMALRLGFAAPMENTYDAVSAYDWVCEVAACSQVLAVDLSRLVDNLVRWAAAGFLQLPDGLVQGSSIMPQKRNPVIFEHVRARISGALGLASALILAGHNTPYSDVNDPGAPSLPLLDELFSRLGSALQLLALALAQLGVRAGEWRSALDHSAVAASGLAEQLALHLGSYPQAHHLTQLLLERLGRQGRQLGELTAEDLAAVGAPELSPEELRAATDPQAILESHPTWGGPSEGETRRQLQAAAARLQEDAAARLQEDAAAIQPGEGPPRAARLEPAAP